MYKAAKYILVQLKDVFQFWKKTPVTVEFPYVAKHLSLNSRQKFRFKEEECTACGQCEKMCPVKAIEIRSEEFSPQMQRPRTSHGFVVENSLESFSLDYASCVFCGICVDVCVPDALVFEKRILNPNTQLRSLKKEFVKIKARENK